MIKSQKIYHNLVPGGAGELIDERREAWKKTVAASLPDRVDNVIPLTPKTGPTGRYRSW
jgi:hypothetical protein